VFEFLGLFPAAAFAAAASASKRSFLNLESVLLAFVYRDIFMWRVYQLDTAFIAQGSGS
jgi:hypothetical protein